MLTKEQFEESLRLVRDSVTRAEESLKLALSAEHSAIKAVGNCRNSPELMAEFQRLVEVKTKLRDALNQYLEAVR